MSESEMEGVGVLLRDLVELKVRVGVWVGVEEMQGTHSPFPTGTSSHQEGRGQKNKFCLRSTDE